MTGHHPRGRGWREPQRQTRPDTHRNIPIWKGQSEMTASHRSGTRTGGLLAFRVRRAGRHRLAEGSTRRPRRWLAIAGVASLLAVLIPLAARGDTPPAGSNGSVGLVRNDVWLGYYQVPGIDGPVVCGHNGDGSWYPDGPYSAGQVVATSGDGAAVAWLLDQYAGTTDPVQAAAIDAINSRYGSNTGGLDDYNIAEANGLGGEIDTLLADGRDNAGPYTVTITGLVTSATGHFDTTYTAAVHVRSAAGNPIAGQTVTLAGHGAHLLTSSVTTSRTGDATFQYSIPSRCRRRTSPSTPPPPCRCWSATPTSAPAAPHMPQDVVGSGTRPVKITAAGSVDPYLASLTFIKYTTGDAGRTPVAGAVFSVTDVTQGRLLGSITSQTAPVSLAGADIAAGDTLRFVETTRTAGALQPGPGHRHHPRERAGQLPGGDPQPAHPDPAVVDPGARTALASVTTVLADQVTISGDDGEDGTDTATLLGPLQPGAAGGGGPSLAGTVHAAGAAAGVCAAIPAWQWATAPAVATYTLAVDGAVNGGNGTRTVTGTSIDRGGHRAGLLRLAAPPGAHPVRRHRRQRPVGPGRDHAGDASDGAAPASTLLQATIGSYLTDTLTLAGTLRPAGAGQRPAADRRRRSALGRVLQCPLPDSGAWADAATVATIGPFTVTGDGPHPVPGRYLTTRPLCYSFTYQAQCDSRPGRAGPVRAQHPAHPGRR